MKHKLLLITFSLLSLQSLKAQQSRTLTLKEAIDMSIANSKQLKLNTAKILEANSAVKEAEEKRLPDAGVSGSYLYLPVKPTINLKSDSAGGGGGPKVSQAVFGMASVSVPLYNGGKLKYGIESAKYLEQALKLDAENDRTAVILNTINACINLFKAKEAISLVKENLDQSQQRVKDLSNLEKNGLLARNDLLKAELQSSNIELTLLDAESNYRLASANMDIMLGLPEETDLIPDRNGLALPQSVKSIAEYEQDALQNRNDVAATAIRKKSAELNIKTIKADYYPSIALTGGYVAADIPKFFSVTNAVNIGVGVKYNISSLWKTKAKIAGARAREQQVIANEELLTDNIRLQVNQAYQAYMLSRKKIDVYASAIDQATENYKITKNKHDNNLVTTTDLLDADVAQLQAKLNYAFAKADAVAAYNKLLQVTGSIK